MEEVNICTTVNQSKTVLATGMSNNTVTLWDLSNLQIIQILGKTASEWVMCVKFNLKGDMVAAGSTDSSVRIWCTRTYNLLHLIPHSGTYINDLSFTPDGSVLIFNGGGNYGHEFKIVFWSLGANAACINVYYIRQCLVFYHNHSNGPDAVLEEHFSEHENMYVNSFDIGACTKGFFMIASVTINTGVCAVALWRFQKGFTTSRMINLRRFDNIFTKIMCHPSGEMALACGVDGVIYALEFPDLNVLYAITLPTSESIRSDQINTFSLNDGGDKLIARARDGGTYAYNLGKRHFEWGCPVEDPENYDEELDLSMMVEFGLGETHYISCSAYEIIRAPFKKTIFIADEFRIEQIADWFEHVVQTKTGVHRVLPDAAKWLICEFVSGVVQV